MVPNKNVPEYENVFNEWLVVIHPPYISAVKANAIKCNTCQRLYNDNTINPAFKMHK